MMEFFNWLAIGALIIAIMSLMHPENRRVMFFLIIGLALWLWGGIIWAASYWW